MIFLFEKNANGKIEFTKEELEALLEQARQEGVKEGSSKLNYIYTTPSNPSPATPSIPYNPYISPFTCSTSKGESEIMATSQTQGVPPIK